MAKRRRNRIRVDAEACYMCDAPGITDEHVPPRCFYQPKDRQWLTRVPSCRAHNIENSKEVEEIRNNISMFDGINDYGTAIAKTKTLASFLRNPKLFFRMFHGAADANIGSREVILNRMNMMAFKRVMQAISYALYYHHQGVRFGNSWNVYGTGLMSRAELLGDPHNAEYRRMLNQLNAEEIQTIHPHVFRYSVYDEGDYRVIYKLEFYEGFVVHVLGARTAIAS